LPSLEDVAAISAAGHSIALKSDGTVWCWGHGGFGQLGDGARVSKPTPVRAEALDDVVFVEAASYSLASLLRASGLGMYRE